MSDEVNVGFKVTNNIFFSCEHRYLCRGPATKKIEVVIGQDHIETLDFAPYTKVEVGNPSILDYRIARKKDV